MMMACSVMVHRLGWLLPQESTMLLQRVPRLQSLMHLQLKAKPMPWRWMTRVLTCTVEDDLLMGSGAVGLESDLAHLMVSSPRSPKGEDKEAST